MGRGSCVCCIFGIPGLVGWLVICSHIVDVAAEAMVGKCTSSSAHVCFAWVPSPWEEGMHPEFAEDNGQVLSSQNKDPQNPSSQGDKATADKSMHLPRPPTKLSPATQAVLDVLTRRLKICRGGVASVAFPGPAERLHAVRRSACFSRYVLDCYWVGSLDFNFLENQGVFH